MNIYDFPSEFTEEHVPKMFEYVFIRQKELMEKYREIESENGFHYPESLLVNIDDRFDQTLLKNMAWRTIEEIGESLEAFYKEEDDPIHAKEELTDGLHFITELLILSGFDYGDVKKITETDENEIEWAILEDLISSFVVNLGTAMNCLKLKPWKQTHVKTDKELYKTKILLAYDTYIKLMLKMMSPLEILNIYFSKSNVNKFRIRSNY